MCHSLPQGLPLSQGFLGDAVGLGVWPDKLIGIEVGGIGWQEVQFQPSTGSLHLATDDLRPMTGVPIHHQIHLGVAPAPEVFEKADQTRRMEVAARDRAPKGPFRIARTAGLDLLPLPSLVFPRKSGRGERSGLVVSLEMS